MHLVFASSLVPCGPPESGYEIANQAIVDGLKRQGARVTHLGFEWPDRPPSDPGNTVSLGAIDVRTATAGMGQKLAWLAKAVRTGTPFSAAKLRIISDDAVAAALDRIGAFDGLILNGVTLAGAFEKVLTNRPFMFVAHNVEHESAAEAAKFATNPAERLIYQREARVLAALEPRLIGKAAHTFTLSGEDLEAFGLTDGKNASALPLVTPQSDAPNGTRVPVFDIGMIGTWTWAPNRIGLEWFLQQVVPHLPEQISIAIAGAMPDGFPNRDPRVRLLGRVLDAKQFVRQCRVIALTARVGTGVQLKTIEAFELGLPAVATPSSLRGIDRTPDNVRVETAPTEFAKRLAQSVVDHRTGTITDLDGSAFRAAQVAAMDRALQSALEPMA